MNERLTERQSSVTRQVLDDEGGRREHLVVHLSGAHAYGFASPDSDVDLKAIHVAPTIALLGLAKLRTSESRAEVIDGVEIDYTSNEVQLAIRGLLQGDGNMLERVLSRRPLRSHAALSDLRDLAAKNVSRRFYNHYRGFAWSQRKLFEHADTPTAKKALYVLRTTLTGVHLLATGECQPDVTVLASEYGAPEAALLIEIKRTAEGVPLPEEIVAGLPRVFDRAFERLDRALERSQLPEAPAAVADLERWLVELRLRNLNQSANDQRSD